MFVRFRKPLLLCGVVSSALYVITDIIASNLYPGYSMMAQAVSELFAIGAPTSRLVVPLFTLSSLFLGAFAAGVWLSSTGQRILRIMAVMILGNAVNSLVLWNFFPMHMRGVKPAFTDAMHAILAVNPFVLLTIVLAVAAFRNWMRWYSVATILVLLVPAVFAFSSIAAFASNQPTPWFGFTERVSQYGYQLWQIVLAITLARERPAPPLP